MKSIVTASSVGEASTLSFRTNAINRAELLGQRRHDLRIGMQPGYVDAERSKNNVTLYAEVGYGPDHIKQKLTRVVDKDEASLDDRRLSKTRARRLWRSALLTFSHGAQRELGNYFPDEHALEVMKNFAARHDIRLLTVVGHRDESAVHYHALFENIATTGRALIFDASELSLEQDHAASHFESLGIARGVHKYARVKDGESPSKTINRSVRQLHNDLPLEIKAKQIELTLLDRTLDEISESIQIAKSQAMHYENLTKGNEAKSLKNSKDAERITEMVKIIMAGKNELKRQLEEASYMRMLQNAEAERLRHFDERLQSFRLDLLDAEYKLKEGREASIVPEQSGYDFVM